MTRADEGVAPIAHGAAQAMTHGSVGVSAPTHDLVRGQLSEYLDGTLGEAVRRRIDTHLAGCPQCSAYLATLRATVEALDQLPAPKAPSGIHARIIERARASRSCEQE